MMAILLLTTIGAVPGQAPPPPQGPTLVVEPQPGLSAKSCACTPACTCGCNSGQACDCPVTRGVAQRLHSVAGQPRATPVVVPQVYNFRPAMQSLYTQPQPSWGGWGVGGGACVGGG